MQLRDIHVPQDWAEAGDEVAAGASPVLVLGAIDSGKSTLVRYLLGRLVAARGASALLDGDAGLAMSGPSGLVGLTLVRDVDSLGERAAPDRAWFVGATTPIGALPSLILGHAKLAAVARAERLPLVVNTSGLVAGGAGKELQLSVIDAVEPKLVVGLDRDGDLAHLLVPLERRGAAVRRLAPSPRARAKPKAERMSLRAERFGRCFADALPLTLRLADYCLEGTLLGSGRPLDGREREEIDRQLDTHVIEAEEAGDAVAALLASPPHEEGALPLERSLGGRRLHVIEASETSGLLLGLLAADGECLGLGRLVAWKGEGAIEVETALPEALQGQVRRLRLGHLRLAKSGEELGTGGRERTLVSES